MIRLIFESPEATGDKCETRGLAQLGMILSFTILLVLIYEGMKKAAKAAMVEK